MHTSGATYSHAVPKTGLTSMEALIAKMENGYAKKYYATAAAWTHLTLFRDFYGRDPDMGPFLEARGLA